MLELLTCALSSFKRYVMEGKHECEAHLDFQRHFVLQQSIMVTFGLKEIGA